jgi:F-type H+-transporting ATPase subunit b
MFTMGIYSYLASSHGGLGLNLNIFETNLINLSIILGLIVVYGSKLVSNILQDRKSRIEEEIREAETRASEAAKALEQANKDLAQAKAKAEQIKLEAQAAGEKAKAEILANGEKELAKLKAAAGKELDSEQAKVIAELKQRIAILALERVESELKNRLDGETQTRLIDKSIAQLGGK